MKKYTTLILLIQIISFCTHQIVYSAESNSFSLIVKEISLPKEDKISLQDAYNVLQLDPDNTYTKSQVDKAYKQLSLKYHPDKNKESKNFIKLTTAKEIVYFDQHWQSIAQGKESSFISNTTDNEDKQEELTKKILSSNSHRPLPKYPIKKENNWPDIKKNYPDLLKATKKHINQQPWIKQLSYPSNPTKQTECFCNDLYNKFQQALSPEIQNFNPHFDTYNKILEENDITFFLTKAIEYSNNQQKKDYYKRLINSIQFHNNLDIELSPELEKNVSLAISEIMIGSQLVEKLKLGKMTLKELDILLENQPNRTIESKEFTQFDQCL
ncbi:MAG: J domain-containing protein [Candidatus Chromulinivorax sp.]